MISERRKLLVAVKKELTGRWQDNDMLIFKYLLLSWQLQNTHEMLDRAKKMSSTHQ